MIIKVKAKPYSKKEEIKKISEKEYEISIKEPAENNKANNKIISILSKEFSISYKKIKIKNPLSKNKLIEIN